MPITTAHLSKIGLRSGFSIDEGACSDDAPSAFTLAELAAIADCEWPMLKPSNIERIERIERIGTNENFEAMRPTAMPLVNNLNCQPLHIRCCKNCHLCSFSRYFLFQDTFCQRPLMRRNEKTLLSDAEAKPSESS